MSKERPHPNTDDVSDPLVSQRYREIASERVPEDLDRAILQRASKSVGQRRSRSLTWLRPMAWAATIGLSLTIVMELSTVPMDASDVYKLDANTPAEAPASQILEEAEMSLGERQNAAQPTEPARRESVSLEQRARKSIDSEGRISLDDASQFSKVKAPAPENMPSVNRQAESPAAKSLPASSIAAPESKDGLFATDKDRADADATAIEEVVVANDAEPLARGQALGANVAREADALVATQSGAIRAATPAPCDAAAQKTPESWLKCIDGLTEAGFGELADLQREQLQEAFPAFELP